MIVLCIVIFAMIACAVISSAIGAKKGEMANGFILGFLLGPLGVIFALISKGDRRKCPMCTELISQEATVCRHCGRDIPEGPGQSPITPLALNGLLLILIDVVMIFVVPVFQAMYADFGAKLPGPTWLLFFAPKSIGLTLFLVLVPAFVFLASRGRTGIKILNVAALIQFLFVLLLACVLFLPAFGIGGVSDKIQ